MPRAARSSTSRRRRALTVSRPALLTGDSDTEFRSLIHNLLAYGHHLEACVQAFGAIAGLTAVQYELCMAVHRFEQGAGISVGQVAAKLHRSAAFITIEINKLVGMSLVLKRSDPADGRRVLVELTEKGRARIQRLAPYQRQVNDVLFSCLDRRRFGTLRRMVEQLVACGDRAQLLVEVLVRHAKSEVA